MIRAPPRAGSASTFSGITSTSFATKSASVPVVDAKRWAVVVPGRTTSSASGSVCQDTTSGRPSTNRWSATIQTGQSSPATLGARFGAATGRGWSGSGLAGSDGQARTASFPPRAGGSNPSRPPSPRYTLRDSSPRGGQAGRHCQASMFASEPSPRSQWTRTSGRAARSPLHDADALRAEPAADVLHDEHVAVVEHGAEPGGGEPDRGLLHAVLLGLADPVGGSHEQDGELLAGRPRALAWRRGGGRRRPGRRHS